MTAIPKDQRERHPKLYPESTPKEVSIANIYEMCDKTNELFKKKTASFKNRERWKK